MLYQRLGDVTNQPDNFLASSSEELDFRLQEGEQVFQPHLLKEIPEFNTKHTTESEEASLYFEPGQSIYDEQVAPSQVIEALSNERIESTKFISDKSCMQIEDITLNSTQNEKNKSLQYFEITKEEELINQSKNTSEKLTKHSFHMKLFLRTKVLKL
ncbi:hypothetical protein EVAR_72900_1 [Eumeta japonica]|uniref:Uncharacterized protein n=1 Tax=Eumeta variegata TaxID=151549 RepID=A0A4C1STK2_EUMVA|nr:hypothetical protein EVAR_72900_1 [Eumeta japonica]